MTAESICNQRHRERMLRKQKVVDELIAGATHDKGLLLVITGNGKGKSSSAFGMVARSLGHGMKAGVVQFIKGAFSTGEETFFRRFPDEVEYHVMGEGFTWVTQDRNRDIQAAEAGWTVAQTMLSNPAINLVVLDELNIVLKFGYLPLERVLNALHQRPAGQHVVITGRGAIRELIDIADTVSEVNNIKHAFKQGIRAQKGIEL
ncbi:cob(I)yrinic acid a,c-diamide adenosyltransferase [Candidatus Methylospira mobilis]|uniref:Corrinoid adenosyltransferase n=1 Tax=Candidatus Methylospira mobilis TaxID=1808979 RepID=A0A5Q0BJU7_9GAMM|nr:cob(I)yrinic acid a,c-diamide adenosyltransferase [Candidatus Methylospira mobilis]QFY43402.1 cob(I)yrinic acid a,c-diamide adenosyltransferase [Candidatus Methylospira mobilis]WNV03361.1 cob(I)yrinic acid a,c-diamide adenosyltransferase [Candidatus Methylospira mobilis]